MSDSDCDGLDHGWRSPDFSFHSSKPSGSVVHSLQVDRTGLAAGCGHCSGDNHSRTPLSDVSNKSFSAFRQKSPASSKTIGLDTGRIFSDENSPVSFYN